MITKTCFLPKRKYNSKYLTVTWFLLLLYMILLRRNMFIRIMFLPLLIEQFSKNCINTKLVKLFCICGTDYFEHCLSTVGTNGHHCSMLLLKPYFNIVQKCNPRIWAEKPTVNHLQYFDRRIRTGWIQAFLTILVKFNLVPTNHKPHLQIQIQC